MLSRLLKALTLLLAVLGTVRPPVGLCAVGSPACHQTAKRACCCNTADSGCCCKGNQGQTRRSCGCTQPQQPAPVPRPQQETRHADSEPAVALLVPLVADAELSGRRGAQEPQSEAAGESGTLLLIQLCIWRC